MSLKLMLGLALLLGSGFASAQVHRCVDANGKVAYSDTVCSASAKKSDRMLGREATEKRWEPEGYRRQQNLDSINRARLIQQGAVAEPVASGPVDMTSRKPEAARTDAPVPSVPGGKQVDSCDSNAPGIGCYGGRRATNNRWAPGKGYHGGDHAGRQVPRPPAPSVIASCDDGGCWDTSGQRYNDAGGGNFHRQDGRFCHRAGSNLQCN